MCEGCVVNDLGVGLDVGAKLDSVSAVAIVSDRIALGLERAIGIEGGNAVGTGVDLGGCRRGVSREWQPVGQVVEPVRGATVNCGFLLRNVQSKSSETAHTFFGVAHEDLEVDHRLVARGVNTQDLAIQGLVGQISEAELSSVHRAGGLVSTSRAGRTGCTGCARRACRARGTCCTIATTAATGKGSSHNQACRSQLAPMSGRPVHCIVK